MAEFRYALTEKPEARNDGSGCVSHQIVAQVDAGEGFATMGGRSKTFSVPADELATVLALSNGAEKVAAYKQLLVDNLNTQPQPNGGWEKAQLEIVHNANVAASSAADGADEYITITLGKTYPVPFVL